MHSVIFGNISENGINTPNQLSSMVVEGWWFGVFCSHYTPGCFFDQKFLDMHKYIVVSIMQFSALKLGVWAGKRGTRWDCLGIPEIKWFLKHIWKKQGKTPGTFLMREKLYNMMLNWKKLILHNTAPLTAAVFFSVPELIGQECLTGSDETLAF